MGADEVIPLPHPSVNPGAFGNGNPLVGIGFDEIEVGLFSACVAGACTAGAFEVSGRAAKIGELAAGATIWVGCCAGCAAGITGAIGAAGRGTAGFGSTRGATLAAGASIFDAAGEVGVTGATAAGRAGAAAGALGAITRSPGNRMPQNPATASVNSNSTYPLTFR